LTPSQVEVIGQLKTKILADDARAISGGNSTGDGYEYKRFHVSEYAGEKFVFLWTCVGHVGDEGTLGERLYRRERMVFVGPRGRVIMLNQADDQKDGPELLSLEVALKEPYRPRKRDSSDPVQHHGHA
jgi:hypothetical protein